MESMQVNTTQLAALFGVTARRVQQLVQDGVITASEKGKYPLADAIQSYIEYRTQEKNLSKADMEKLEAEVNIKKAKAILMVMEAKELQGKMHRSEDVAAFTEDLIYTMRGMLLALPGRLAVDAAAAETPPEAAEVVREEVYKIMQELARYTYDSKKYEARVRERRSWDVDTESFGEADT